MDILNFSVIILSIPFFLIYRKIQYTIYSDIDWEHQTEDDYAIFIENIPTLDFPDTSEKKVKLEFSYRVHLEKILKQKI